MDGKKNMLACFLLSHSFSLWFSLSRFICGVADVFHRTYTEAAVIIIQPSGFS